MAVPTLHRKPQTHFPHSMKTALQILINNMTMFNSVFLFFIILVKRIGIACDCAVAGTNKCLQAPPLRCSTVREGSIRSKSKNSFHYLRASIRSVLAEFTRTVGLSISTQMLICYNLSVSRK